MTKAANSHIDEEISRTVAYERLGARISVRRAAWLGVCALGAGCNQFIGLEEVSLAGDAGVDPVVDAAVDAPAADAAVDAAPVDLYVFVTDQSFRGDFGAASGARTTADVKCDDKYQLSFTDKGCTEIHAFIQIDDTLDTLARMDSNFPIPQASPVLRAIDDTPVASNWDELVNPNANLLAPISDAAGPIFFWSGRSGGGNLQCTNWTSTAGQGNAGDATTTSGWTERANVNCDNFDQKLVCVCW